MSSIPSSAMPHAKAHDDEDLTADHAPKHDKADSHEGVAAPTDADAKDSSPVADTVAQAETKVADVSEKVAEEATKLADSATAATKANPKSSFAVGALVAVGVAALAALPFLLSRSDAEQPKPKPQGKKAKKGG